MFNIINEKDVTCHKEMWECLLTYMKGILITIAMVVIIYSNCHPFIQEFPNSFELVDVKKQLLPNLWVKIMQLNYSYILYDEKMDS